MHWKYNNSFLTCSARLKCTYWRLSQAVSKEFVGESIGKKRLRKNEKVSDCEDYCDGLENCQSFSFHKKKRECDFKNQTLNGNEPLMCWDDMYTVYKRCEQGNNPTMNQILPKWIYPELSM